MMGLYLKMAQFHFLGNNLTAIENSRLIQLSHLSTLKIFSLIFWIVSFFLSLLPV